MSGKSSCQRRASSPDRWKPPLAAKSSIAARRLSSASRQRWAWHLRGGGRQHPFALDGRDGRERAHLAQSLDRAERQIEPRRIGAVDDIDVVVAGQNEHPPNEFGMRPDDVEKFGPFGRCSRVRHVAADEHEVERLFGVQGGKSEKCLFEPLVAARAAASAFDAKSVAFADDMNIREMRDPPDARARRRGVEGLEIERLVGAGVGKAPDERPDREIDRHDDGSVGDRRNDEEARGDEIRHRSYPLSLRPGGKGDQPRDREEKDSRAGAAERANARQIGAALAIERPLGQVPQRLAPDRVAGLDRQGVQRPEVGLCEPEKRAPADPSDRKDRQNDDRRADPRRLGKPVPSLSDPAGQHERREAQQDRGQQDRDKPGEQQFR